MEQIVRYGIDLGTTNSAIAYFDGEETHIFKNRNQMDVTPSVVRISKSGEIRVGHDAYNSLHSDPENTVCQFKRWIGQKSSKTFKSSEITMNAEELSSEILKSLILDVKKHTGKDANMAVITVPTAFGHLQCEATARAASKVGLVDAPLLQEPIAAAIAYGVKSNSNDKNWLIYDLGGGTFDIAVVSIRDGRLAVIEHRGDNMLGGKDFDRLIVEKIILPKLKEIYELPNSHTNEHKYSRLIQKLKKKAEEIKIDLSYNENTVASIFNVGEDEYGEIIEEDIYIDRVDFEEIIKPYVMKTVELCREAIKDARLSSDDFESIILVGGSTYIPVIREVLEEELNIHLDFSIDPMTVVARGASVYAASLPIEKQQLVIEDRLNLFNIELDYPNIASGTDCFMSGYIDELRNTQEKYEICISDETGYWSSGWIPLKTGYFEADIQLLQNRINYFNITMRDKMGKQISVNPESFSISTIGCAVSEIPLPYSIEAECVRSDGTVEMDIIFKRSTPLPAQKIVSYKAAKKLSRNRLGKEDYIGIKISEGEYPNPEDNNIIAVLKILSNEIERTIPKGAEIELNIEIDTSRKMCVEAYVPIINQHFSENVYIPEPELPSTIQDIKDGVDEIYEIIDSIEIKLDKIEDFVEGIEDYYKMLKILTNSIEEIYLEVYEIEKENKLADADDCKRINQEIKKIRGQSRILKQEVEKHSLLDIGSGIYEELDKTKELVEAYGDSVQKEQFEILESKIERQIEKQDSRGKKKSREKISNLKWEILCNQEWFWKTQFDSLKQERAYINKEEAQRLILEGEDVIETENYNVLRKIVFSLIKLLPKSEAQRQKEKAIKAGIRKARA